MPDLLNHFLTCFEADLLPATADAMAKGNKLFGAALLDKRTHETILIGTNNETENPLWHGEIHTIKLFHELPNRPDPKDLIFLSSHEPCSMCLSAITWAGFDNFTYLFSYEDSRDAFAIPHDLRIMDEVFGLPTGAYRPKNAFWKATAITDMVAALSEVDQAGANTRIKAIRAEYDRLSAVYQSGKHENDIPLN